MSKLKMKKMVLTWSFLFCNVFLIGVANAGVIAAECNNCTDSQLYQIAINRGVGTHYYYDLTQGRMTAWQTTREPIYGGYQTYADEINVPSTYLAAFDELKRGVATYGRHTVDSTITINPTTNWPYFPQSYANYDAYQVVLTGAAKYDIGNWLNTFNSPAESPFLNALQGTIVGIGAAAVNVIFGNDIVSITFNVIMKDGSVVTFDYVAGKGAKFVSAVDKNHNPIPLSASQITGIYLFSGNPNGLSNWTQYMDWLGVTVVVNPIYSGTVTVGCTAKDAKCIQPQ